jgi:TolA-binding protein
LAAARIATRYYLQDLGQSAGDYLRGQGYKQAAAVYRDLLRQDPRQGQPEALVGLGESLLALGDVEQALTPLTRCIEAFPKHPVTYRARWLASYALQEQGKLPQAAELLVDNLYRHSLAPQSSDWQDSLFAYGFLKYRQALEYETQSRMAGIDRDSADVRHEALAHLEQSHAAFDEAVRALKEAVQRYPDAAVTPQARYCVAESYRHRAKWPRKRLGTVTIETTRVALTRQIQEELQAALDQYNSLIAQLSSGQPSSQSAIETAILRNCYFGRADALFDLGRFEEAAQAYSAASNRYQHEPEALEAYVQIASCYRRLSRHADARSTLEQARVVLQRIRSDADFVRTTRYNRDEWAELLTWLRTL